MTGFIKDEIRRIAQVANTKFMANNYPDLDTKVKGCMKGVFFFWGHPLEIVQKLQLNGQDAVMMYERLPLIALYNDITVRKGKYGDYDGVLLEIIIANHTEPNYDSEDRENYNFRPILRPVLYYFLQELCSSNVFKVDNPMTDVKAEITERYFWGKQGLYGNKGNIFNDYVDAIHIRNLDLKLIQPCI